MMCTRLYPDIIVAAEINNAFMFKTYEGQPIYITIDNCLKHQKNYKYYGISNAFIGFEDDEWNKTDYVSYLNSVSGFFTKTEKGYEVNIEDIQRKGLGDDFSDKLCSILFKQGTYPLKVLKALGLATEVG